MRRELFESQTERLSYGPSLRWVFLDIGRVRQRVLEARAGQRAALAAYDETLLQPREETENALAGYRAATESLSANEAGLAAARTAAQVRLAVHHRRVPAKQLIWEGIAVGRVTQTALEHLQPTIDSAVTSLIAEFPVPAAPAAGAATRS